MRNRRHEWNGRLRHDGTPLSDMRARLRELWRVYTVLLNRQSRLLALPQTETVTARRRALTQQLERVDAWIVQAEAHLTRVVGSR